MEIGFVGLGVMGRPMVRNLLAAGHRVTVASRSPGPVAEMVAAGAVAAADLADLARGRDAVITMLPDSPDVEAVVLGPGGVLEASDPGTLIVDMSTVHPATARSVAAAAAARGCDALDAPVSGGEAGAVAGTLAIMVGGGEAAFAAARPLFDALGTTVRRMGPAGAGQTVKAANQMVVGGTLAVLAEAVTVLTRAGIDPAGALEVLAGGMARSRILEQKGPPMLSRAFEPGFRVDLHEKDMRIVADAAAELGVPLRVSAPVGAMLADLVARGLGDLDHSALVLQVEADATRSEGEQPGVGGPPATG